MVDNGREALESQMWERRKAAVTKVVDLVVADRRARDLAPMSENATVAMREELLHVHTSVLGVIAISLRGSE